MDLEETLEYLSQNIDLLSKYSENERSIEFIVSIKSLKESNVSSNSVVQLFMNCFWLIKEGITPSFYVYLKKPVILAELDISGNLNIDQKIYDEYIWKKIEGLSKIDDTYKKILDKKREKKNEKNKIAKNEEIFQLFTDMLFDICSLENEFDPEIQVKIEKQDIEKAISNKISQIKDYIRLCFWLKEEKFLEYLDSNKITKTIEYFSDGKKIPLVIIPGGKLRLKSKFFYILPSWTEIHKMEASEIQIQHKNLKEFHELAKGFPPSILLQDEVLESKIIDRFWKLIIYSVYKMIADSFKENEQTKELQFEFSFGFKSKIVSLNPQGNESLLKPSGNQEMKNMFSSLKLFNEKYTDSLKIRSLRKGWKIAFNEVLGLNMDKFFDANNIQKIINLYDKLVEKAFDEELDKLTNLIIIIEKSTLDIIDQITKTINSISSEVHNSTIAVFGALIIQIIAIMSRGTDLIWLLGVLLILLFIIFYIPMVNRKINGLITNLSDTRDVYEKNIENSFEILDLPQSKNFLKVKTFNTNVKDRWSKFETSVSSEIGLLRFISIFLYVILVFLVFIKSKNFDNIGLLDFFIIFTPVIALICMFLWKIYMEKDFLKKYSVYNSRTLFLGLGILVCFIIFMALEYF